MAVSNGAASMTATLSDYLFVCVCLQLRLCLSVCKCCIFSHCFKLLKSEFPAYLFLTEKKVERTNW